MIPVDMKSSLLALAAVLLANTLAADDFYLPLGGALGTTPRTELHIVNVSSDRANISIALIGAVDGSISEPKELALNAGESLSWSDAVSELFGSERFARAAGAIEIRADRDLKVAASTHFASGRSRASLPILSSRDAVETGRVPTAIESNDLDWHSGIVVLNPDVAPATATLTIRRGKVVIEESLLDIPSRGMRRVAIDQLFRSDRQSDDRVVFSASHRVLVFGYDVNGRSGARVVTPVRAEPNAGKPRRRAVRFPSTLQPPPPQEPHTIALTPSKDNTLYESSSGATSNGVGPGLFAGTTAARSIRRALVAFDLATQIPPGSRIRRVELTMQVSRTPSGDEPMNLHRVTRDWGEGASNAGSSRDGDGTASRAGDATWLHTFFPDARWSARGGDFEAVSDATGIVTFTSGKWESSDAMIARVQQWLDQPATNFGWIIIGDETSGSSVKRFDSRESASAIARPTLTIEYVK
jgi:hypothetical protein